jgi:hypothetical protein
VLRGIKANYGNWPDGKKYSEKKDRSAADEDSNNHHRVCGKMLHRQHTLQDFRVLTGKRFCGAEPTQKVELNLTAEREIGIGYEIFAPTCAILDGL